MFSTPNLWMDLIFIDCLKKSCDRTVFLSQNFYILFFLSRRNIYIYIHIYIYIYIYIYIFIYLLGEEVKIGIVQFNCMAVA